MTNHIKALQISSDASSSRRGSNVRRRPDPAARTSSPIPPAVQPGINQRRWSGHCVPLTSLPCQMIANLAEECRLPDSVHGALVTYCPLRSPREPHPTPTPMTKEHPPLPSHHQNPRLTNSRSKTPTSTPGTPFTSPIWYDCGP